MSAEKPRKRVVVIGAGVAGLSTAVYLASSGVDVDVYEAGACVGGVCVAWKRKGMMLDGCIHFTQGGAAMHRYLEVGAIRRHEDVALIADVPYRVFTDEATGRTLSLTGNLDQLQHDMDAISPADAAHTKRFIDACAEFRRLGGFDFPAKPIELMGILEKLSMAWNMSSFIWLMRKNAESLEEFCRGFKDQFLARSINNIFTGSTLQFAAYTLGMKPHMFRPRAGSSGFSEGIARKVQELGGKVHLNSRVSEVVVDELGKVRGIKLAGDTESTIAADAVVSACDLHTLVEQLLGNRFHDRQVDGFFRELHLFEPLCIVSLCLAIEPAAAVPESSSIFFKEHRSSIACTDLCTVYFRVFRHETYPEHVPVAGQSVVQVLYSSNFDLWEDRLKASRETYDAAKQQLATEALGLAKQYVLPVGTKDNDVLFIDVATPHTWVRYTGNFRGAFEGFHIPAGVSMASIPTLTHYESVDGLFMTGQWASPGGGIMPAIGNASHCAQLVCARFGIPFIVPSAQFEDEQVQ